MNRRNLKAFVLSLERQRFSMIGGDDRLHDRAFPIETPKENISGNDPSKRFREEERKISNVLAD
jgi:hypothetical protein